MWVMGCAQTLRCRYKIREKFREVFTVREIHAIYDLSQKPNNSESKLIQSN